MLTESLRQTFLHNCTKELEDAVFDYYEVQYSQLSALDIVLYKYYTW